MLYRNLSLFTTTKAWTHGQTDKNWIRKYFPTMLEKKTKFHPLSGFLNVHVSSYRERWQWGPKIHHSAIKIECHWWFRDI